MAVLVTGGAGYIGTHCARELEKAGYAVRVNQPCTAVSSAIAGNLVL